MEPIYVGLLNDSFPPQIDGVVNAVLNYAGIIQQKYGKAIVATPYYPDYSDAGFPFEVVRYQSMVLSDKIAYRAGNPLDPVATEKLSREPIEILHAHCPVTALMLGRTIREARHIPLVLTYHTKFDIDIRNAISMKLIQETAIKALVHNIECCDEVWVVSKGAGDNLRSLGYKGDYLVMENGVDVPKGAVPEDEIHAVCTEYGIDRSVPVFLFVGRLMWYKGIRLILEAIHKLKETGTAFQMVFVGTGTDEREIRALSDELGLNDTCVFTGAIKNRDKLRAVYSAADLFLFPSTFDTNGLVVREAAAAGLASVLIQGSCAAEGVTDGMDGILIEETSDDLFRAIYAICSQRDAMKKLGQQAMDHLYCSWETSVERAVTRYHEILKEKNRLKFHPLWLDDYLYRSMGETYSAVNKLRDLYDLAKEQRNALFDRTGERTDALIDQVLERRESLQEHLQKLTGFHKKG